MEVLRMLAGESRQRFAPRQMTVSWIYVKRFLTIQ